MIDALIQFIVWPKRASAGARHRALAFVDYAYMPYALGDTLTWVENAQVVARDAGVQEIDVVILASRDRPSPSWQPQVNSNNFAAHIHGLLPAFLTSPLIRNVHILEQRNTFYATVTGAYQDGTPTWPPISALIEERLDFITHLHIVDHFKRAGSIPLLCEPRGYTTDVDRFVAGYCPDRFKVVVNVRQSHLRAVRSNPERDSNYQPWAKFIQRTATRYPDVCFIVVGQYSAVDRRFERLPATIVPRSKGFGLGVELSLLQRADVFMGTSSGFAQAALFGRPSYIVTNTEPRVAANCGVAVGARHHPFGRSDQIVTWEPETADSLEAHFHAVLADKSQRGERVPAAYRR